MVKAQVRQTDEYFLHVQVKTDKDDLSSPMNRSYGYAFNLEMNEEENERFLEATEGLQAELPSLANTEARYYPAEIIGDGLYVDGKFILNLPDQYAEYGEEEPPKEKEKVKDKDLVKAGPGLNTTDKWAIFFGDYLVFVQSKDKPEVRKVKEVINVNNMS